MFRLSRDREMRATDLGLDVKNTSPARFRHVLDGHETGPVEVGGELSVFNESTVIDHLLERFLCNEVVMLSIDLSRARRASRVWIRWFG